MTPVRSSILYVLLVLTAISLSAQPGTYPVWIDPADPTSNDPVTLIVQQFDSCPPAPTVSRSGSEISVIVNVGVCLAPPTLITHNIELGALPPGQYNVKVAYAATSTPVMFSFVVLGANDTVRVSQSIGSKAGGTVVNIAVAAAHCFNQPPNSCPPPSITFGGITATDVVVIDQSHFRATTPAHTEGAVQVTVVGNTFTKSSYAFRYIDTTAAPSPKFFEKILLPVILNGPGAFGSNWVTELSLRNRNPYAIEPWRAISNSLSIAPSKPLLFGSGNAPAGLFVIVPRQAAARLSFHAGVRDTSRANTEWATEIPVVRETEFSTAGVDLLDIPADPRFRTMLRIYSPRNPVPGHAAFVHVTVYSLQDGSILREFYPSLGDPTDCADEVACAERPSYAAISDLTAGLSTQRVGVQVQGSVPLWAFATITNNDTHRVTVVSPH